MNIGYIRYYEDDTIKDGFPTMDEPIEKWFVDISSSNKELPQLKKLCGFIREGDSIFVEKDAFAFAVLGQIKKINNKVDVSLFNHYIPDEMDAYIQEFENTNVSLKTLHEKISCREIDVTKDGSAFVHKKKICGGMHYKYVIEKKAWLTYLDYYKSKCKKSELVKILSAKLKVNTGIIYTWLKKDLSEFTIDESLND